MKPVIGCLLLPGAGHGQHGQQQAAKKSQKPSEAHTDCIGFAHKNNRALPIIFLS